MHGSGEEPRFGSAIWGMAIVVVTLGGKVDPLEADLLMAAITVYMMWRDVHGPDELK
ncbi:hypothetical protein [Bifidobacterium callitrichidarum]|uniref:hypothetical protein n=1 Tax=Bifidobacterium callitrichidarum TaxID=2052941 RepID=UPI001304B588|nr:hypothetical protein [Bifidobacterium callitrichidarum]